MTDPIRAFRGPYFFLSNFFIEDDGKSAEHRFQAVKATTVKDRTYIWDAPTPSSAKRRGQVIPMRENWDRIKDQVMTEVVRKKFADPKLRRLLLNTGDAHLEEGNDWGDTYWGTVDGKGENRLGQVLMKIRSDLRAEEDEWT